MNPPIRALIVDDEAPARERLAMLLAAHAGVIVAGEAADIESAADRCERLSPDVLFLGVHLGGATGFDLLPRLTRPLAVVFVAAYDTHAARAFEVNAIDYLLKPVDPGRLAVALARLKTPAVTGVPQEVLSDADTVTLRDDRGLRLVSLTRITHIESDRNYTRVHVADEPPAFVRRTMIEWHRSLPGGFLRVGRSLIVRVSLVREVQVDSRDTARVHLAGCPGPLLVARRASLRIRRALDPR